MYGCLYNMYGNEMTGELYNYAAVTSSLVFELLYHIINFGHNEVVTSVNQSNHIKYDPRILSELDPVNDLFRAQLICEILNTCGVYYVRGQTKEKLMRFLVYFQRYLLTKQFIPLHIEFMILDTFDNLEELARDVILEKMKKNSKSKSNQVWFSFLFWINYDWYYYQESNLVASVIFKRYDNIDEVQAIIDNFEQNVNSDDNVDNEDDNDDDDDDNQNIDCEEEEETDVTEEGTIDATNGDDNEDFDNDFSEQQAAKMLEKLRIAEEDDEFEKAFKNILQVTISRISYQIISNLGQCIICIIDWC